MFKAEVLFDRGDALKRMINLLTETGDVLEFLREFVEVATDRFWLAFNARYLFGDPGDVSF
jgi:hypothetical protein